LEAARILDRLGNCPGACQWKVGAFRTTHRINDGAVAAR
jgi:hypothetical protein